MEIVIKIDDERYKDIQRIAEVQLDRGRFQTAEQVIANGTPLPKGRGRLNGKTYADKCGFEPICTNGEARDYFKKCGLTYSNITEGDILSLVLMINRELKKSNKIGETSVNTISLSKKIDMAKNTNGTIKSCYLYLNSHYFTRREAISFNAGGFIGFAGWADDGNLNPLKRAFLAWCDELRAESEVEE